MLVVIGIIGVLSGITGVMFGPGIAKSKTKPTCANHLRQVAQAYTLYQSDNDGGWPVIGGMVSNDYLAGLYKNPRACPLNPDSPYRDNYTLGRYVMSPPGPGELTTFLDGRPVPTFHPSTDVLARCLDHGAEGFSRGNGKIWVIDENTRGRVLGVRLDGSVRFVSPLSCWEARRMASPTELTVLAPVWRGCDYPATP